MTPDKLKFTERTEQIISKYKSEGDPESSKNNPLTLIEDCIILHEHTVRANQALECSRQQLEVKAAEALSNLIMLLQTGHSLITKCIILQDQDQYIIGIVCYPSDWPDTSTEKADAYYRGLEELFKQLTTELENILQGVKVTKCAPCSFKTFSFNAHYFVTGHFSKIKLIFEKAEELSKSANVSSKVNNLLASSELKQD